MARKSKLEAVGTVLSRLLESRGMGGSAHMARLAAGWEDAVGKGVASHARPDMLKGGTLTVIVDNSSWMNQLSLLRTTIIEQINTAIGKPLVDDLRFRLGEVKKDGPARRKSTAFVPERRSVLPEEKDAIEKSLESIKDDEVKKSARRLLMTSCSRKK